MKTARRLAVLGLLLVVPSVITAQNTTNNKREALREKMRELWDDHAVWERMLLVSITSSSADRDATTSRLLRNQVDIGDAFVPYYGKDDGARLTELLKEHVLIGATLVDSAKSGWGVVADSVYRSWHANGEAIVQFLNNANPKQWPVETLRLFVATHLQQTQNEVKHRLAGHHTAEIRDWDGIQSHMLKTADLMTEGIIQQFPHRFYRVVAHNTVR